MHDGDRRYSTEPERAMIMHVGHRRYPSELGTTMIMHVGEIANRERMHTCKK